MGKVVEDMILYVADVASLPGDNTEGKTGRIAIVVTPNSIYRDNGTTWDLVFSSAAPVDPVPAVTMLFSVVDEAEMANDAGPTDLLGLTTYAGPTSIEADVLVGGSVIRIRAIGRIEARIGGGGLGVNFELLGAPLVSFMVADGDATHFDITWILTVRSDGPTGQLHCATSAFSSTDQVTDLMPDASAGIDTTAPVPVVPLADMSEADADNKVFLYSFQCEILQPTPDP